MVYLLRRLHFFQMQFLAKDFTHDLRSTPILVMEIFAGSVTIIDAQNHALRLSVEGNHSAKNR